MTTFTLCKDSQDCPRRETCFRHTGEPDLWNQSWSNYYKHALERFEGVCHFYVEVGTKKKDKVGVRDESNSETSGGNRAAL